ncbi:hypothetical protein GOB93_07425 [Acetobacter musti]|uniref:Uncharacterized protein n=1 Tax=Acetobacter musti TaxID=864732 RepID=A0ABX0JPJ5_9PROT|nr:hypothetical protein [Acetobacter musti]NHN84475.1 hypothetical protein [Acetobacter musti]
MSGNSVTDNVEITSGNGKKIEYREMNPGEILDFLLACGNDGSANEVYLNAAQSWCSVRTIDGVPMPFPRNKDGIRDLVNRLGTDGINAVEDYISSKQTIDRQEQMEEIKN